LLPPYTALLANRGPTMRTAISPLIVKGHRRLRLTLPVFAGFNTVLSARRAPVLTIWLRFARRQV
ncbi:MAG: hypothetical protein MI806_13845, partial [Minwuiales bacterium]|nr:hypothetical protein [Minwuiales bacterium]